MYAPSSLQQGSSVAHFDTTLTPNELMEPFDAPASVDTLTIQLMADIGWKLLNGVTPGGRIFDDQFE
jgi:hypothetical protein